MCVCVIQVFGGAVVGATVADDGEQDGEAPLTPAGAVGGEDHLYQVVGTLKDPQSTKPPWVTDIIQVLGLCSICLNYVYM